MLVSRPGGGGTSGGSLRSSRQAVACHPFTRSWATMPPKVPSPPGLLCYVVFTDGLFNDIWLPVRIKTFSTHVELQKGHVVSKTGVFTHENIPRGRVPPVRKNFRHMEHLDYGSLLRFAL